MSVQYEPVRREDAVGVIVCHASAEEIYYSDVDTMLAAFKEDLSIYGPTGVSAKSLKENKTLEHGIYAAVCNEYGYAAYELEIYFDRKARKLGLYPEDPYDVRQHITTDSVFYHRPQPGAPTAPLTIQEIFEDEQGNEWCETSEYRMSMNDLVHKIAAGDLETEAELKKAGLLPAPPLTLSEKLADASSRAKNSSFPGKNVPTITTPDR